MAVCCYVDCIDIVRAQFKTMIRDHFFQMVKKVHENWTGRWRWDPFREKWLKISGWLRFSRGQIGERKLTLPATVNFWIVRNLLYAHSRLISHSNHITLAGPRLWQKLPTDKTYKRWSFFQVKKFLYSHSHFIGKHVM